MQGRTKRGQHPRSICSKHQEGQEEYSGRSQPEPLTYLIHSHKIYPSDPEPNGVDIRNFLVAELARSFDFAFKNLGAENLGDFRYGLSPRHLTLSRMDSA